MTIGASIFLIALGAVLAFAVNVSTSGFDLNTIGVILMVIGALGIVVSLIFMGAWNRRDVVDSNTVVREREIL